VTTHTESLATATLDKVTLGRPARLLTAVEAAEYLGMRVQTLAAWRCNNRYPDLRYIKVGQHIRYRLADLERWLQSRTVGSLDAAEEAYCPCENSKFGPYNGL
jgi:excisionase family DNA binding protein